MSDRSKETFERNCFHAKAIKNRFKIRRWLNVDSWTYRTFNRFGWTMSKFIPRFFLGASCFPTFAFIRGKFSLLRRTRLIARHFLKDPRSIWRALFPAIFVPVFSSLSFFLCLTQWLNVFVNVCISSTFFFFVVFLGPIRDNTSTFAENVAA